MDLRAGIASIALLTVALVFTGAGIAREKPVSRSADALRAEAVVAQHGMVVTQEKQASRIGAEILAKGGNAVDAAVAVGFALAVTLPRAGNLGGGGFMVLHRAETGENVAIDYRETAPAATTPDMFLDADGNADPEKSRDSALGVGVPGTVAGLALAHARYGSGRFTLAELVAPAVQLAREGVPVEGDLLDSLLLAAPRLQRWPSTAPIFTKPDGPSWAEGDRLVQPELASSLEAIGREGARAFYIGPMADAIVSTVREAGGRMTRVDLENYQAIIREPARGTYRGYEIISMPPPSSGGVHLIQMLNILEGLPLKKLGAGSPAALHLMIEAMKLAFADRAEFLGDADVVDVPVERLISKEYAAELRAGIAPDRARPAIEIRPDSSALGAGLGGGNTTHFSIIDQFGNAVANTTSLNLSYGLGLVAKGTGILLNNTLDDFAAQPGAPNAFGLLGGNANAPGPSKRPLSSMTPTIVLKDGKPQLITGAPGGSRIISTVLQVIVNNIDFGRPIADAVTAPRVHHQWRPDEVLVERTLPAATVRALEKRGHHVEVGSVFGSAHSIAVTPKGIVGAADPRARDSLAVGF
ncbi:MAG: gamma-glutamyltransferase [Rhodoplanes sp.]